MACVEIVEGGAVQGEEFLGLFELPRVGMRARVDLGRGRDTYVIAGAFETGDGVVYACHLAVDPSCKVLVTYADLAACVVRASCWWEITQAASGCQIGGDSGSDQGPAEVKALRLLELLRIDPQDLRVGSRDEEIDRAVACFRYELERHL